jgi:DNA-binding response OmpR family regulator
MPRAESLARLQPESFTRPVVVLAMDDADTRAMYAYAIVAAGFDVALDDRALAMNEDDSTPLPDVLVADVTPESTLGWTFVRKLKSDRRTSHVPVIAIAADIGFATRERARDEGCAAVCPKTCPAAVLTTGIRAVLNRLR